MADKKDIVLATASTFGIHQMDASSFADNVIKHQSFLATRGGPSLNQSQQIDLANKTAVAWQKDHSVVDRFAATLSSPKNKAFLDRYHKLSPADAARAFLDFSTNPRGLANDINRFYANTPEGRREAQTAAAQRPNVNPAPVAPPADGKARVVTSANGERHTVAHGRQARVEPIAAAAGMSTSSALDTGANGISVAFATSVVEKIIAHGEHIYGKQFAQQEDALRKNMAKPGYAQKVANAINADSKLVEQLNAPDGGDAGIGALVKKFDKQDADIQEGIRKGLKKPYSDFLENPAILGNKQFRDGLEASATGGGKEAFMDGMADKINEFCRPIFGPNFDIRQIFEKVKTFCGSALGAITDQASNLKAGFNAGGGITNVLTMGNGQGMLGGAMAGIQRASDLGALINSNARQLERDSGVHARDLNGDHKFDQADTKMVNGQKVYQLSGVPDNDDPSRSMTAYAEKVDPSTGRIVPGGATYIDVAKDGVVTTRKADEANAPAAPAVAPKTVLEANKPQQSANNIPSPATGMAPPASV